MTKTIKNAKPLQKKSRTHAVRHVYGNMFQVVSGASGRTYYVRVHRDNGTSAATCDCPWGTRGGVKMKERAACSHVQATFNHIAQEHGRTISAWGDMTQAKRQHRPLQHIGDGVWLTSRKVCS